MSGFLIISDRLMYASLLAMVFFLPFSFAMIEACQVTMIIAWVSKCVVLYMSKRSKAFQDRSVTFFSSSIGASLTAIALLILLTIPFSHDPSLSIKKFFSRFLQQVLLMCFVTQCINTRKRLYCVLSALLLMLFFITVDVGFQYFGGVSLVHHKPLIFGRVSGSLNHPNDLGTLLVTVLPVVLVLMITYRSWIPLLLGCSKLKGRKASWIGMVIISILFFLLLNALGLTASRGAWVAFAISIITLGFCLKRQKVTILIILILTLFFGVFGMHCLSTRIDMYKHRPVFTDSISNPLGLPAGYNVFAVLLGPSGREFYWGTAVSVIKHFPLFGCGYSAYVQTLRDLRVGHEEYPHNSFLHITAELGFAGLILYGWFFTTLFFQMKNILKFTSSERDLFLLGCGVSTGILAWFIHSLMDTAWASYQLSVLWWLFIGILLSLKAQLSNQKIPLGKD